MKRPNLHKSTIGQVLEWCANHNGKVKGQKQQAFIAQVLSQASFLDRLKDFPWTARKWADKAWHDIQAIGITDGLELTSKPPVKPLTRIGNLVMAVKYLGLHLNKVNNRHVITRKPLTQAAVEGCRHGKSPTWKQSATHIANSTSKPTLF